MRLTGAASLVIRINDVPKSIEHWPLVAAFGTLRMGWAGVTTYIQALICCTKCNSPPAKGQCTQVN